MRASPEIAWGGRRLRRAAAFAAFALVLGACRGEGGANQEGTANEESPTSATATAGAAADLTPTTEALVQMTDALRFQPAEVVLKVGGRVTWTNPSTMVHSATGDPAKVADASHVELPPGAGAVGLGFAAGKRCLYAAVHRAGNLPLHVHPPRECADVRHDQSCPLTPLPGDDSAGFDELERTFVRRFVPDFDWLTFDEPSPRRIPPVPLSRSRVGLVVTAGAHLPEQEPMSPTGEIRLIPVAEAGRVRLSHIGYDTERASRDPDVVVPVRSLQRLVDGGFIGSLAPTIVSGMGFVPRGLDVLERSVPDALEALRADDVDLALLVPA